MVDGFGSRVLVGPVVAATRYGVPLGAAIRWRLGYRHGYPIVRIGSGGLDEARHHGDDGGQETSRQHTLIGKSGRPRRPARLAAMNAHLLTGRLPPFQEIGNL
jgi:hypothetical protein